MTATLTAGQLWAAARAIENAAAAVADERHRTTREADAARTMGAGEAMDAFAQQAATLVSPLAMREEAMHQAVRVLRQTAELGQVVDWLVARVEPWADSFPPAQRLLALATAYGDVLDRACAHELLALCTAADSAELTHSRTMAQWPHLSAEDLHELNMFEASPEIAALVAENPDLRIVELHDGGFVGVIGDCATATTISTYIAGVGSGDPATWATHVQRARELAGAMPTQPAAGVVWLAAPAPSGLHEGLRKQPGRAAGQRLRDFHGELRRRYPQARLTTVGFSYGTVVAAQAARAGLATDDLVLVGSPGAGAETVDAFHLESESPRVFATRSPGDPIGLVTGPTGGVHGVDPTSPGFGARVIDPGTAGDHHSYFTDGTFYPALTSALRSP